MLFTHYIDELSPKMDGQEVALAGWAHEIRDMGKLKFILLRDRTGLAQITAKKGSVPDALIEKLNFQKEAVLLVKGKVRAEEQAPSGFEIIPSEISNLNPISTKIPFELTGKVPADIDTRLDNRVADLRRLETRAVFKVRSEALRAFREKLIELRFQEINPPCLVEAATEGGTELFPVIYFEKEAFLIQSPQLYKQLAVIGGMDRVFMITPIFRAEKHNTPVHLNEVTSLDVEIGFADHNDAMNVLEKVMKHIIATVNKTCASELALLNSKPSVPQKIPRYTYTEIVEKLKEHGAKVEWGRDFRKDEEHKLKGIIKDELFFITEWPTETRAFYSMPREGEPKICNAFDLVYKGLEIASGAQRVHLPDILIKQLKAHGLEPNNFKFYVEPFRMGAPPHAGWAIGAERLAMKLCNRDNIRECALFPRDRNRLSP